MDYFFIHISMSESTKDGLVDVIAVVIELLPFCNDLLADNFKIAMHSIYF